MHTWAEIDKTVGLIRQRDGYCSEEKEAEAPRAKKGERGNREDGSIKGK